MDNFTLNETEFCVCKNRVCTKVKYTKVFFFFFISEAKYVYLVLVSVRILLDCNDDYNDSGGNLAKSIFGLSNMNSFFNFIFHVDSNKISGLLC